MATSMVQLLVYDVSEQVVCTFERALVPNFCGQDCSIHEQYLHKQVHRQRCQHQASESARVYAGHKNPYMKGG